jgi:hypothetical protein
VLDGSEAADCVQPTASPSRSVVSVDGGTARWSSPGPPRAQTLTSFARFLEESAKHPAMAKSGGRLDQVHVLPRSSRPRRQAHHPGHHRSNRQNPVGLAPSSQRLGPAGVRGQVRDDLKIFYERQENAFEAMQDSDLETMGIEQNRAIEIRKLAQTFLAIQGEIDRMSRLSEVFESQRTYDSTFRKAYLDADARQIVVAYKIQFRLRRAVQSRLSGQVRLPRARNLSGRSKTGALQRLRPHLL